MEMETSNAPLQAALDAIDAASAPNQEQPDLLRVATCRALLIGYAARWQHWNLVPTEVETTIKAAVVNPETGAKGRILSTAGKIDVVVQDDKGHLLVLDHKTTSEDIVDPAASFWRQLVVEAQPTHYLLLKWLQGEKMAGAMWDVIRKPTIRPEQVPLRDERGFKIVLGEDGIRVRNAPKKAKKSCDTCHGLGVGFDDRDCPCTLGDWRQSGDASQGYTLMSRLQTPEEWEEKLSTDIASRPEFYFQRRSIPRLDAELMEYAGDLWQSSQLILAARATQRDLERKGKDPRIAWPKHPGSCMNYGRACQFLGICSGFDTAGSANWVPHDQVHVELPELEGNHHNTITFSSIRRFQSCPRAYLYRYEMGLEHIDDDEAESLRIGTLIHQGLEAFWKALLPEGVEHGGQRTGTDTDSGNTSSNESVAW